MPLKLFRVLGLLVLASSPGWGQLIRWSADSGTVTNTTTVTLQQPSSNAKIVTGETVTIYCSAACTISQAQNGAGATTTAGTLTPITNSTGSPVTKFFTASNVGAGTAIGPSLINLAAGQTQTLDISKVSLPKTSSININYSITVTVTGTCIITIIGTER